MYVQAIEHMCFEQTKVSSLSFDSANDEIDMALSKVVRSIINLRHTKKVAD